MMASAVLILGLLLCMRCDQVNLISSQTVMKEIKRESVIAHHQMLMLISLWFFFIISSVVCILWVRHYFKSTLFDRCSDGFCYARMDIV